MWTVDEGRVNGNNCNPNVKNPDPPTEENDDLVKLLACYQAVLVAVGETQERLKEEPTGSLMRAE